MTLRTLFASFCLLTLLFAAPSYAQDRSIPMPQWAQQENEGNQPQLAPAVKPGPLALPDIFQIQIPNAPQLSPAELKELYHEVWETVGNSYHTPAALKDWANWQHKYDGQLKTVDDLEKALKEMLGSLNDRWTEYISATEIAQARADARAGIVDLGMLLKQEPDGTYRIDYLSYGSPAHKSDLRKGDLVKSVAGKTLKGMAAKDVEKLLKGKTGTKVTVVYLDSGKDVSLDLTFAATPAALVDSRLLPGNIAYLRLPDFSSELMIGLFLAAVEDLNTQAGGKIEGIVFDLRGNPGGQFQLAILVSSLFLEKGTIVTGTTRSGRIVTHTTYDVIPVLPHTLTNPPSDVDKLVALLQSAPLVVLTDGSTASAAEIVTGALKDNGRAVVVGGTTYGKGVGYSRFNLPTGGVLLITSLDYLTPSGFNLSNKGIQPNQAVDQPRGSKVDEQLNAGVRSVKDQILNPVKKPDTQKSKSVNVDNLRHVLRLTILLLLLLLVINLRRSRR
ncbi:MAG TPA: S41 family peptidase [Candidatus Obscuribacterales bacterium]